jgi:hypothetical protein
MTGIVTRADLIEALLYHNTIARRLPRHHVDKLTAIHAKMNDLLDMLDIIAELEAMNG